MLGSGFWFAGTFSLRRLDVHKCTSACRLHLHAEVTVSRMLTGTWQSGGSLFCGGGGVSDYPLGTQPAKLPQAQKNTNALQLKQ